MRTVTSPWVIRSAPQPHAKKRLFCIPFAGGGASAYRKWANALGPSIEVCPIQLPGRENRLLEPAYDDCQALTDALLSALRPFLDKPYSIYGHSMGALLAFELARQIEEVSDQIVRPERVFVAAHRAAHLPLQRLPMADLPQEALIAKLNEFGGFSSEALNSPELMELLLPTIRADLKLCDTYHYEQKKPLRCPLEVIIGALDHQTSTETTNPWALQTAEPTKIHTINEGHFFLHTHLEQVIHIVRAGMLD